MNPLSRITRGLLRLGAGVVVIAVIVIPIIVMAAVAGNPLTGDLVGSLGDRQIGNDQVIKLLSIAFYALWAWFAIPALRQVAISLTTPSTSTRRRRTTAPTTGRTVARANVSMPADEAGPRGWLAQLVRFALGAATVATTITAVTTGFVPTASAAPTHRRCRQRVAPARVRHARQLRPSNASTKSATSQRNGATPRTRSPANTSPATSTTPRNEILTLNTGRPTPHGTPWSGGAFPVGMNVITPHLETDTTTPPQADAAAAATYRVRPGDGWINVVEGLWGDDAGDRWQELRIQLIGQTVAPGVVVTADTTTIHPGWVFTQPTTEQDQTPAPDAIRVVEPGDTLHDLVDDVIDEPVTRAPHRRRRTTQRRRSHPRRHLRLLRLES